jgi:predicted NBD/HSP70 family sugar kinase
MSLSSLFTVPGNISRSAMKTQKLKRNIIKHFVANGNYTIAELSQKMDFSLPTITKVINELQEENIVFDFGKIDTTGGRRPNVFGINPKSGFYLGVEVNRQSVTMALQDLKNEFVKIKEGMPFVLMNTAESLDQLCQLINKFVAGSGIDKKNIISACINLTGRINSREGFSYNYFFFEENSLSSIIESKIGIKIFLENDSRAMAFGEYCCGIVEKERNVIFVNISWGVGIGIITDGKLYYGKSGYSGEFGHSPLFDNNILCQCGKKGCLETEVSGWALERDFKEDLDQGMTSLIADKYTPEQIKLEQILETIVQDEDVFAIDMISKLGEKMGRYLSILINIFNPELVVIGGSLSVTGDYLMLPIRSAIKKYSLNLVSHDMALKISKLGTRAGVIGACYTGRERFLDMLD